MQIEELKGLTLKSVTKNDEVEIIFETECGRKFVMYHEQDCCESVCIESIDGDLQSLVGKEILSAYESTDSGQDDRWGDSYTWTFYRISSIDDTIVIRWYGASNGYYSERVSFVEISERVSFVEIKDKG